MKYVEDWQIILMSIVCVLHYGYERCYWGELHKGYIGTLYIISYNCWWIYDDLKIKKIKILKIQRVKNKNLYSMTDQVRY